MDKLEQDFLDFVNNCYYDSSEETDNGLCFNGIYVPEEVALNILSYINPCELLQYCLVCRKWNNLIKSYALWSTIYKHKYNRKPKKLPWYLYYYLLSTNYFNTNLLQNGNGEKKFDHWQIKKNGGHKFIIEDPPVAADPLPLHVPEFNNRTSCFATSYGTCCKMQQVIFGKSKLFRFIMDAYKPYIYLSEWMAGRFDCGCVYMLQCRFIQNANPQQPAENPYALNKVEQWMGSKWEKIEITVMEYPEGVEGLWFEHKGRDTQYWSGHYGSKMAGGVVKILFESFENLPTDDDGNIRPKTFSQLKFVTKGTNTNGDYFNSEAEDMLLPSVRFRCGNR